MHFLVAFCPLSWPLFSPYFPGSASATTPFRCSAVHRLRWTIDRIVGHIPYDAVDTVPCVSSDARSHCYFWIYPMALAAVNGSNQSMSKPTSFMLSSDFGSFFSSASNQYLFYQSLVSWWCVHARACMTHSLSWKKVVCEKENCHFNWTLAKNITCWSCCWLSWCAELAFGNVPRLPASIRMNANCGTRRCAPQ